MRKLILYTALILSAGLSAQRIRDFNVFMAQNSVGVRFTITKGNQCFGYKIWHSADSMYYNVIYDYPGICGDVNNDQEISFTHTAPVLNQMNFYKVELIPYETSSVRRVYVGNANSASMMLYPNPVVTTSDQLSCKIYNVSNLRVVGFLINQYGKPLREVDLTTVADTGKLDISDLTNGLYVLWLTDGSTAYSSKFIVYR